MTSGAGTPAASDTEPPRRRRPVQRELVVVVAGTLAVILLLGYAALRQDRLADAASAHLAASVLRTEQEALERAVSDYSWWSEAYQALVTAPDPVWADAAFGHALTDLYAISDVFMVDAAGTVLLAYGDGRRGDPARAADFGDGVPRLAAAAMARAHEAAGRTNSQRPPPVSGLLRGTGGASDVHIAAASLLAPSTERPGQPPDDPTLVFLRRIDARMLERIGHAFGFVDLRIEADTPFSTATLPLQLADGSAPVHLRWRSTQPGRHTLDRVAAPVAGVLIAMGFLVVTMVRREQRIARAVDEGAVMVRTSNHELALAQRRFRDFAEAASDWFWETGPDHRYVYVSERVGLIIGGEPQAVFGDSLLDLGGLVGDRGSWDECRADIGARRGFRDLEVTWDDPSGKPFVFRISGQPVFDDHGGFAGYRGTGVDVTVETMALVEARFMQVVVHDALNSISEGFVLFNADGRLLVCNDRYRQAYPNIADVLVPGVTFEEVLRTAAERGGYEGARNDLGTWIRERLARHLATGAPVDQHLSDGRWYRISEHATGSGGVVKILMDITELKEREQQLAGQTARVQESEGRYRQLVELAPYGIAVCDRRAARYGNTAAAGMLGLSSAEALEGRELAGFFDRRGAVEAALAAAVLGHTRRLECEVERLPGDRRNVELGIYPASFLGEPGALLVMNDVTERRRTEAELQRAQKMEAVGRMAGGIAHEFNNMLTAIGGFARLAERNPSDATRVLTCVREIAKASDRAAALTGQLLDFSRRKISDETETVALGPLVGDLKIFLKPLLTSGIDLVVDLRAGHAHAVANPVTLNQAVLNLALNARDAMPMGGRLVVTLDTVEPDAAFFGRHDHLAHGRYAVLRVSDTGGGVPDDIRDRIWEPFFTTKEPGKGTGLGLWMVYGTARQSGGTVEMESDPGRGSVFSIYLPLAAAPAAAADGIAPVLLPEGEAASVLLVDDEEQVRAYLRLALIEAGCQVVEAVDGRDALARYDEHGGLFDLVVTDVSMPRMNGAELARALDERNPGIRMLFLTGYASRGLAAGLTELEGRQLLMKPIDPERLIQAVRELLSDP